MFKGFAIGTVLGEIANEFAILEFYHMVSVEGAVAFGT